MLGFFSAYDENEKQVDKKKISFVHINSSNEEDIKQEMSHQAHIFANSINSDKVYLFFGKEGKIIYDYTL